MVFEKTGRLTDEIPTLFWVKEDLNLRQVAYLLINIVCLTY